MLIRKLLTHKIFAIFTFAGFAFLIGGTTAYACCLCNFNGNGNTGKVCLETPIGQGCGWAEEQAQQKSNEEYELDCVSISVNQCQKVQSSASALCPNTPIIATDFRSAYIEDFLGYGRQAEKDEKDDEAPKTSQYITPKLGVDIPGVKFESPRVKNEYLLINYIGAYVSGFQKYLFGVALIAAAVMLIWGGILYIYSAKGIDTQRAKDYIKDALMGMAIIISAYVILVNLNPNTARLDPLKVKIVEEVPFPSERGYFEPQIQEPPVDWDPGRYVDPDAEPFNPLLKLDPSDSYEDFYEPIDNPTELRPVAKGDTPAKRMFSVCAADTSLLKNKSREEQIKYAAGVLNVWINEGIINKGSVYVRTGFTSANGKETSCTNGTIDPIWYKRTLAYQVQGCGPVGAGQISYGGAVMSCDQAMDIHETPSAFQNTAGLLALHASDGYWYCNSTGALDPSVQLILGMIRADQPAACDWHPSTIAEKAKRVGDTISGLRLSLRRSLDSMRSPCRPPVTNHFRNCYTRKVGKAGYFCGDCGSSLAQYMSCVGINPNNELFFKKGKGSVKVEQLDFHVPQEHLLEEGEENIENAEESDISKEEAILNLFETGSPNLSAPGGGDPNTFLGVVGNPGNSLEENQQAWRQMVEDVGGLQFGDMHFSNCHNYMFVGGAGLKFQGKEIYWFEMGGGGAADVNPNARVSVQSTTGQNLTAKQLDEIEAKHTIVGRGRFPPDANVSQIAYSGFRIRFDPDISAYAGTSCGKVRSMWPIYIYRPFQDPPGTLRCDPNVPSDESGCPPDKACMGNRRCKTIEEGTICQDARGKNFKIGPAEPSNCATGQICRSCTKEEIVERGYLKPHSVSGALVPVGNMQKASYQLLPCYHNAFGSQLIRYCMPAKTQEQIDFENNKYK
ncbi:hypothetical protein GF391_00305 [Candidatus Uhrbacteria bacterium]|nr:hypothetical protein [Candidatus Uhrbacteria bacterium]